MDAKANGPTLNAGRVTDGPTNPMVTPLLTDLYQFTMAYAYWKAGKHNDRAVFDLYFRKNPFGGEFTVFAGLEECIKLIANFKLTEEEISFICISLPGSCEEGFVSYLRNIDCSDVEVYAISEGTVVFPKVPLLRVEGPVAVVQLLETPVLNLVNFASLVATNAARHRLVAGKSKMLLEFGLRRAQGPDGAISASKYCYIGGFDATSNVAAGRLFGIPLRGTHSHAFVSSFMSPDEILDRSLSSSDGSSTCEDFVSLVQSWISKVQWSKSLSGIFGETNQSELAAFMSYALAFPNNFLALVDTYDVMRSGIPNFCAVALALNDLGHLVTVGSKHDPTVKIKAQVTPRIAREEHAPTNRLPRARVGHVTHHGRPSQNRIWPFIPAAPTATMPPPLSKLSQNLQRICQSSKIIIVKFLIYICECKEMRGRFFYLFKEVK